MSQPNVADMPQDYWGWTGDCLIPLGIHEGWTEACDKADTIRPDFVWIFGRGSLMELRDHIEEELK